MKKSKRIFSFLLVLSFSFLPFNTHASILLDWVGKLGGVGQDYGYGVSADSLGNVYSSGYFTGTADFDPGAGTANLTSAASDEVFVSKLKSDGTFDWVKQIVGAGEDEGYFLSIDPRDNSVYVSGYFTGTADFDPDPVDTFNMTSGAGVYSIFILKLDSTGDFLWAKQIGASGFNNARSIGIDSLGYIYLSDCFTGTADFDPGVGTYNLTSGGGQDAFVLKLDSDGNFVWAKDFSGTGGADEGYVTVDSSGNSYVVGNFDGTTDFDPGTGTYNLTSTGSNDIFVVKLDSDGNFLWAKNIGGTGSDASRVVSLDSFGNIYTSGYFSGTVDFDPGVGTYNLTSIGGIDAFVLKLDSDGNFVWARQLGGTGQDVILSSGIDSLKNIYLAGSFAGTVDFDPGAGTYNLTAASHSNVFIVKLNTNGSFMWAGNFGGDSYDFEDNLIFVDSNGNIYSSGFFVGTVDFDPGAGTTNLTSVQHDIFVAKFTQEDDVPTAFSFIDQTNTNLNKLVESESITVSGIAVSVPIYIDSCTGTNCEYSINDGAFTSVEGTVSNGDVIKVHQTTSADYSTKTDLTLNIGGVEDTFSATTSRHIVYGSVVGSISPVTTISQTQEIKTDTEAVTSTPTITPTTPSFTFTKLLKYLVTGTDVKELQKFLNTHGYQIAATGAGSPGHETNYFGTLTKKAVIKFQLANKLAGDGIVGAKTNAVINSLK